MEKTCSKPNTSILTQIAFAATARDLEAITSPPNYECTSAVEIVPNSDIRITGDTTNTTDDDFFSDDPPCDRSNSPALWDLVRGTGQVMTVDTCSEDTDFDTFISVHEGACGDDLVCSAANDDICGSDSGLFWPTVAGVDYYIRVGGFESAVGRFSLRLTAGEAPPNDVCSGATELTPGVTLSGSLQYAVEYDTTDCFENPDFYPGVWYYMDGTGSGVSISTCDSEGNANMVGEIQVFKGSTCSSEMACEVFTEDFSCPFSPWMSAKFFAEEGERYYNLLVGDVSGSDDSRFKFNISATELTAVENDVCEGAYGIDDHGFIIDQTTVAFFNASVVGASPDTGSCGQFHSMIGSRGNGDGVWYTVEGTGLPMEASTCSEHLTAGTFIRVFSGNCNELTCVAFGTHHWSPTICPEAVGSSRVIFENKVNTTYYILVDGFYYEDGDGNFDLTITSDFDRPSNDVPALATKVVADGEVIVGSTANAVNPFPVDDGLSLNDTCAFNPNAPGVWYSLDGTGSTVVVSTCANETQMSAAISVMSGSYDNMECVAKEADNDPDGPTTRGATKVTFRTEAGVE